MGAKDGGAVVVGGGAYESCGVGTDPAHDGVWLFGRGRIEEARGCGLSHLWGGKVVTPSAVVLFPARGLLV